MSILAQCGYGRGVKVNSGLEKSLIKGAILSPRDEKKDTLERAVCNIRNAHENAVLLFDPQFYVAHINAKKDGKLGDYSYYSENRGVGRMHFSGARIRKSVKDCIKYQNDAFHGKLDYIISPSIMFDSFTDSWSQIAISMAFESIEYCQDNHIGPLLINLVISDTAFSNKADLDDFLDNITKLDADGFYIIIRRLSSTPSQMEPEMFSSIMYLCHVLGSINSYRVVIGYCDWNSIMLEAAGADFEAVGWYQNLRQFSTGRFFPSNGGRRPNKRYSSVPIMTSILINPEMQDVYLAGCLNDVLSGSEFDNLLSENPVSGEVNWTDDISCMCHWHSLTKMCEQISSLSSQKERLDQVEKMLYAAKEIYKRLALISVNFESIAIRNIEGWIAALKEFRSEVNV